MAAITSLGGTRFLVVCPGAVGVQFYAIIDQATISEPAELSAAHGAPATLLSACVPVICSYANDHECVIAIVRTANDAAGIAANCASGNIDVGGHWILYRSEGHRIHDVACACCPNYLASAQKTYAYFTAIGDIRARDAFIARILSIVSAP